MSDSLTPFRPLTSSGPNLPRFDAQWASRHNPLFLRARVSQDFFDRSEIYQSDTADEDGNRVKVLLICVCTHSPRVYVLHPQDQCLTAHPTLPDAGG